jgi:hypothetical protein
MKLTRVIAVLAILSLVVIPALGEMTDYQKGAMDGMKAGLRMGKLLGAAPYDPSQAQLYNDQVNAFNQGLTAIFGNDQTVLDMFWMQPLGSGNTGAYLGNYSAKPIHAIDASWNQTRTVNPDLLSQGKYFGYDLDSYIAMTGHVPANVPDGTTGIGGEANPYGSLGAGP